MTLLVSTQVQNLLSRERLLLGDLQRFLELQGAPPEAVAQARQALSNLDEAFLLVVVGEFNAGKSSFMNALLGEAVLPEGVTPTTDRIYVLVHGEKADKLGRGELQATADPFVSRLTVPLHALQGVALVDTPGTNAIIRQHQALTEGFLPRADLLLFLTSADRPFTESERQFLELARRWGRSVMMVVNKADLLETPEQREQVRAFVEKGARDTLGVNPPVFLVSARAEQRGGDAGFAALREVLKMRLSETERTRLKLESPLAAAQELLTAQQARSDAARQTLASDLDILQHLQTQRQQHHQQLESELGAQLSHINKLLGEFEVRADKFIDQKLRLGNVRSLINSRNLEDDFRREAVADLPEALERQFGRMIDRFVESNLHFWEDVQLHLLRHTTSEVARSRFSYDRAALIEAVSGSAQRHLETTTQQHLTRQMSQDAESAMKGVLGFGAGGLAIGAATVALVTGAMADFTGVLAGIAVGSLGLVVLPQKRLAALRSLRQQVAALRENLETTLRREYAREQERADQRLEDALRPFTGFISQQQAQLDSAKERGDELVARLAQLKEEVAHLQ